jgi:hypothetical protein
MFAREVDRPLARTLVAAEVSLLPDTPACVTAQKIGVAGGVAQRGPACVVGADTGEDTLQLLQAVLGITLDIREVISSGKGLVCIRLQQEFFPLLTNLFDLPEIRIEQVQVAGEILLDFSDDVSNSLLSLLRNHLQASAKLLHRSPMTCRPAVVLFISSC